jgi:hypothetical protein
MEVTFLDFPGKHDGLVRRGGPAHKGVPLASRLGIAERAR